MNNAVTITMSREPAETYFAQTLGVAILIAQQLGVEKADFLQCLTETWDEIHRRGQADEPL
jgi:hypothetical protein